MDGRKRTVQIKFRVTEAERDLILEKMKLVPTRNMAAYLRKIAIDGYIIQIDHADIKAMTAEIQKIGVNVNQISLRLRIHQAQAKNFCHVLDIRVSEIMKADMLQSRVLEDFLMKVYHRVGVVHFSCSAGREAAQ